MTPADLRATLVALPWDNYTLGELNEISVILSQATVEAKESRRAIHETEQRRQMDALPRLTPEQIDASKTKEQVYPTGSRLD